MPEHFQREKTPTILQMDNAECGAVVLSIIMAFFGRYIPISEAREACDVSRDGSKAINIIKAARQYGLDAHGLQLSLEKAKLLPPPFIVFWQFNHFLIVEGFSSNKVYINDPATGPRTISETEFAQGFTGIVLFMNPGPEFQTGGKPEPAIWRLIWQYILGTRLIFLYVLVTGILFIAPIFGLVFFTKLFFDYGIVFGWGLLIVTVLTVILTTLKEFFLVRLDMKLKLSRLSQFFSHLLHLPIHFYLQRAAGDLADRTEANSEVAHILAEKLGAYLVDAISLLVLTVVMFWLSWPLALSYIILGSIGVFLSGFLSQKNKDLSSRLMQLAGKLAAIEINGLQIIETLKANAVEDSCFNNWANAHAEKVSQEQILARQELKRHILTILIWAVNFLVLLVLGCWLILQTELTIGGLLAIFILFAVTVKSLNNLANIQEDVSSVQGEIARINDVSHHHLENILSDSKAAIKLMQPNVPVILEFKNVVFGYSRLEPPILAGISFQVKPGERIAIVGPTGGGKSSVAKLICGLYAPWSGDIDINEVPLPHTSREFLAAFAGLVDQEIYLFAATVRENLTLWNPKISDAEINQALRLACMDEIIRQRGGLDCWVEERGKNFSGGQVQRLEIARALIAKPHILILDEATSALDPVLEQQIYQNLQDQHCSLVIIAHRLSAIRDCHQILVIDQGQIVQQGRHETLIQASGLYKDLISLEIQ